ncbi:MAG: phosphoadenylyl-sulfate reductase [Marinilabiliales bacterium]
MKEKIAEHLNVVKDFTPQKFIEYFANQYSDKIIFASSMGMEDQVITDMISKANLSHIEIITIDTGRLFTETYDLISRTCSKYKLKIKVLFPDYKDVEQMVYEHGINLFYNSIESRKLCCEIRKVKPFQRALQGNDVWISGLRKSQSVTRNNIELVEWDNKNKLIKVNPLLNWSFEDVKTYIKNNNVPYNPLHDKHYPSIGCQPCTREVMPGEDLRAGRWWWENPETKECGLNK